MFIISHRVNTIAALHATPGHYGVEIDVRSAQGKLILQHDAMTPGEDVDRWLEHYRHAMLVLNTKEEGLEQTLMARMQARGITGYFFLDTTPPFVLRLLRGQLSPNGEAERRVALRLSEYESVDSIHAYKANGLQPQWVWLDFAESVSEKSRPLLAQARLLQKDGYRICMVSPELYGPHRADERVLLQTLCSDMGWRPEAICSKIPAFWESAF